MLASGRQPGDDGGADTGLTVCLTCSDTQMAADTTQSQSEILTSLLATTAIHSTGEDASFLPGLYTLKSNLKSIFQCVILSSGFPPTYILTNIFGGGGGPKALRRINVHDDAYICMQIVLRTVQARAESHSSPVFLEPNHNHSVHYS